MLDTILLIIAAVCFILAALDVGVLHGRVNLVALGLFCWVLSVLT